MSANACNNAPPTIFEPLPIREKSIVQQSQVIPAKLVKVELVRIKKNEPKTAAIDPVHPVDERVPHRRTHSFTALLTTSLIDVNLC